MPHTPLTQLRVRLGAASPTLTTLSPQLGGGPPTNDQAKNVVRYPRKGEASGHRPTPLAAVIDRRLNLAKLWRRAHRRQGRAAFGGGPSVGRASLDRGCARRHSEARSGRRNGAAIEQRNQPLDPYLTNRLSQLSNVTVTIVGASPATPPDTTVKWRNSTHTTFLRGGGLASLVGGIEQGLMLKQSAGDRQQAVGDSAQGAAVAVTAPA